MPPRNLRCCSLAPLPAPAPRRAGESREQETARLVEEALRDAAGGAAAAGAGRFTGSGELLKKIPLMRKRTISEATVIAPHLA